MPFTPPVTIPAGQRVAYAFPTQVQAGAIQAGGSNGGAVGTLVGGSATQTSSSPLGNPGFSVVWENFKLTLPPGAVIKAIYPFFQNLEVACPDVVPFGQFGSSTVGALSINVDGLGGSNFNFANPSNGQATTPGPSSVGTVWDPLFEIGIQVLQTNSSGPYVDTITATRPCFVVYYSGGFSGMGASVPTGSLISSGPSVPDNCLLESRNERKIGTLIIDWTQLPILGGLDAGGSEDFSFPEFTYSSAQNAASGADPIFGYQTLEIDLATAWGGLGLDEVRAVIITGRPSWSTFDDGGSILGPSDSNGTGQGGGMLLTATKTQQTVVSAGAAAAQMNQNEAVSQIQAFPFFVIGKPLTVRFLNLLINYDATVGSPIPAGKYQVQFCNFDVAPFDTVGFELEE